MKKHVLTLIAVMGIFATPCQAEYSIRYLGSMLSDDEQLIDASPQGWLLIEDNNEADACPVRVNLKGGEKIRLCEKGLRWASHVNNKGVVVGSVGSRKQVAVWSDNAGLKVLDAPSEGYDSVTVTDMNNHGEVVGFTSRQILDANGDYDGTAYQAYRWRKDGAALKVKLPRMGDTQAVAINDQGKIVVYFRGPNYRQALYLGRESFKRIDKRGQGTSLSEYPYRRYSINNRGQIASNGFSLFSPRTGWRKVNGIEQCDRCDYDGSPKTELSESGKAIMFSNNVSYLLTYPKAAVQLGCLLPRNRTIENTPITASNIAFGYGASRFLSGDTVVFSADIVGDNKKSQLLILEKKVGGSGITDYCPTINLERSSDTRYSCEYSSEQDGRIVTCKGSFSLTSADGLVEGANVSLYAKQSTPNDETSCAPILLNTFTTSGTANQYAFPTDPGFEYYLTIADPKFGVGAENVANRIVRYGNPIDSAITPCRAPFEGLPRFE